MSSNGFEQQQKLRVHICKPENFSLVAILIRLFLQQNCKDSMFPDVHV